MENDFDIIHYKDRWITHVYHLIQTAQSQKTKGQKWLISTKKNHLEMFGSKDFSVTERNV